MGLSANWNSGIGVVDGNLTSVKRLPRFSRTLHSHSTAHPRTSAPGKLRAMAMSTLATGMILVSCTSAPAVETQPVGVNETTLTIMESGEGQKARVRWSDDGADQDVSVIVTQGFVQKSDNGQGDQTFPDTRLELPLSASVSSGQDVRAITTEVGTPHGSNATLNEDIATAEGFLVESSATATGATTELAFGAPESSTDTARAGVEAALRQLHNIPVVFPEEEIGVGATWTVESTVDDYTELAQKVTYTLVGRTGDVVDLKVAVEQVPALTELDTGGETALKVIESKTNMLADSLQVDLTKPLPVAGRVNFVNTVTYGDGTSDVRITQQTHRGIEFKTTA